MKKRYLTTLVAMLFAIGGSSAQNMKMVESSAKHAPAWVNSLERGYIILMTSESSSLEAAKEAALLGVKQQIAQSITTNVSVDFLHSVVETQHNDALSLRDEAVSIVRSTTDKIPFLQSISLTKTNDFYWEKYADKKSGQVRYDYHLKYPFSDYELKSLVDEFNAKQNQLNATIERMSSAIDTFTHIEDIAKNIGVLTSLTSEFATNDPRIAVVDELLNRYRNQYRYISIVEVEHSERRALLKSVISGRDIKLSQAPTYKSNGADRIVVSLADGTITVTYDDYVCRPGDDNWIELTFRFGSQLVQHKIYIVK